MEPTQLLPHPGHKVLAGLHVMPFNVLDVDDELPTVVEVPEIVDELPTMVEVLDVDDGTTYRGRST